MKIAHVVRTDFEVDCERAEQSARLRRRGASGESHGDEDSGNDVLLQRRPDILRAEREMMSASTEIDNVIKNYFSIWNIAGSVSGLCGDHGGTRGDLYE